MTSYNPLARAKEVIVQRYSQEFQGMSSIGEGMIRRLVDMDLEREGRSLEAMVWRNASEAELAGFAESVDEGLGVPGALGYMLRFTVALGWPCLGTA